jgi:hypothetical protein
MLWCCAAQFTELQQKEQLAKLALARQSLAAAPATRKFKFVSGVNDQVCTIPEVGTPASVQQQPRAKPCTGLHAL